MSLENRNMNVRLTSFSAYNTTSDNLALPFTSPIKVNIHRMSINNKKSYGIDKISNFVLRKCPYSLDVALSCIFNHCINNGYFPTIWKKSKVIPIAKKKSAKDIKDFRPISLLSNVGKLFERVLAVSIDHFCDEMNVIPNNQFGFKKNHSTEHCLLLLNNKIIQNLRNKKCSVVLDIDLQAAFDSIWHKGLIFKLIRFNFPDALIRMVSDFLSSRTAFVCIGSECSEEFAVLKGVVQGSLLGPKLFNIYLSDFPFNNPESEPESILFADDTKVLASAVRPHDALNKIKDSLPILTSYLKSWGLILNAGKSHLSCFRNTYGKGHRKAVKESKTLSLAIENIPIPLKTEVKYLGIHFDHKFKFNTHARKVLGKAKMASGLLKQLLSSKHTSKKTKILIYKTLIRPIISYGFGCWFTISPTAAKELEVFERKILRFCCDKHRKPNKKWYSNVTPV